MLRYIALCLLLCSPTLGQTIERLDNVKMAPITVRRPNGQTIPFGLGASTDAARGTALIAAQSAATSGDTIHLGAGTYDLNTTATLNKVGINYDLATGAVIARTAGSSRRIFYDSVGALTTSIIGGGSISTVAGNGSPLGTCFDLRNASSSVTFVGKDIVNTDGTSGGEAIYMSAGKLYVRASGTVASAGYDAIICETAAGGILDVDCALLDGDDNAVEYGGGIVHIKASTIVAGNECFQVAGSDFADRLVVEGDLAYCDDYTASGNDAFLVVQSSTSGYIDINVKRIESHIRIQINDTSRIYISDCQLNTSGQAFPSIVFTLSGSTGMVLSNVNITTKSDQTYSIEAAGATTITVIGNVTTNKPIDSDITFAGPGTVVANGVCVYMGTKATTSAGLALLDDASATAQRDTLGATNGTWGASQVAGTTFSVDAAGTAYTLIAAYTGLDFGTTDPTITINRAGTYLVLARVEMVDAALVSASTPTFKLRRTNNTAADLTASESVLQLPSVATQLRYECNLPSVIYTTANTTDIISLFGKDVDEAGLTVPKASIRAIQISTGTP
jgi:hypothetical protein